MQVTPLKLKINSVQGTSSTGGKEVAKGQMQ